MFCATHPQRQAERLCARCRNPACPACVRRAGPHAYCGNPCALMALMEQASAAAFALAVQASRRSVHTPLSRLRLVPVRLAARRAQHCLDAYLAVLEAGRPAQRRSALRLLAMWPPAFRWARVPVAVPVAAAMVAASAVAVAFVLRQPGGMTPATPRARAPEAGSPATPAAGAIPSPPPAEPAKAAPVLPSGRPPQGRTAALRERTSRTAPPPAFTEDLSRGSLEARQVALTFDADSERNGAEAILEALRARGLRATMFLSAGYIRKHPDLVRRIVADGHEVANHMKTHPRLTSFARDRRQATLPHVTREFVQAELGAAEESFREVTGRSLAPLWRAPYGEHNAEIRAWAAEAGYRHVGWTRDPGSRQDLDTRDWVADPASRIYRSSREIRDRILRFGAAGGHGLNGGIVLMHLGTQRRRDPAHARLAEILDALAARGYRLVTVSEMLGDTPRGPEIARLAPR